MAFIYDRHLQVWSHNLTWSSVLTRSFMVEMTAGETNPGRIVSLARTSLSDCPGVARRQRFTSANAPLPSSPICIQKAHVMPLIEASAYAAFPGTTNYLAKPIGTDEGRCSSGPPETLICERHLR